MPKGARGTEKHVGAPSTKARRLLNNWLAPLDLSRISVNWAILQSAILNHSEAQQRHKRQRADLRPLREGLAWFSQWSAALGL